jgi:hypothetical protein
MSSSAHKYSCKEGAKVQEGLTSRKTDSFEIIKRDNYGRSAPVLRLNIEISSDLSGEDKQELMAEWFSDLKKKISDLFEYDLENESEKGMQTRKQNT